MDVVQISTAGKAFALLSASLTCSYILLDVFTCKMIECFVSVEQELDTISDESLPVKMILHMCDCAYMHV